MRTNSRRYQSHNRINETPLYEDIIQVKRYVILVYIFQRFLAIDSPLHLLKNDELLQPESSRKELYNCNLWTKILYRIGRYLFITKNMFNSKRNSNHLNTMLLTIDIIFFLKTINLYFEKSYTLLSISSYCQRCYLFNIKKRNMIFRKVK